MRVNIVNYFFHFAIVLIGVLESEIASPWKDEMLCSMDRIDKFMDVVDEFEHLCLSVEAIKSWVRLERVLIVDLEVRHPAIVVSK